MADDLTSQAITPPQAAAQIKQLHRVNAMLVALTTAVAQARTRAALCDEVCRIAMKLGEYPLAWIGSVNEADRSLTPVAVRAAGEQAPLRLPLRPDEASSSETSLFRCEAANECFISS